MAIDPFDTIDRIKLVTILLFSAAIFPQGSCAQSEPFQKHASLQEQKICAEQAKKFFNDTDYSDDSKKPLKNEFTSHYDAVAKVCYVRIDYNTFDKDTKAVSNSSYVFDAFEGRNLASYIWFSDSKKKYWEVKPFLCEVKPINHPKKTCSTTEEFELLVDRLFGLGE